MTTVGSRFIVFEGTHGSGKTTQAELFKNYLDDQGIAAIYTKEPYLDDLKKIIDKYSYIDNEISSYILLYLHAADRFAHIKYIKDKLENGINVIADRYLLSSCVYQQIQGIPLSLIEQTNFFCIEPDLTFIFDVPLSERRERLSKSGRLRNTIFLNDEAMRLEDKLYKKIHNRYEIIWRNIKLVDGRNEIETVHREVIKLATQLNR